MTTSHWLRHSFKTPDLATDILIVGGGYVGLSVAYWLTELRPDLKVTVLERQNCGAGASGRNAGFLTMGSAAFYKSLSSKWGAQRAKDIFHFAAESLDLAFHHILKVSPEIKYERSSSMTLLSGNELLASWKESGFNPADFNFNWKDQDSLPQHLRSKFIGGYEASPEYKVNPLQILGTLKNLLENRKVQIIENCSAFELHPDGVQTEINLIKSKKVILALNGYFPQFHSAFKDSIIPRRAQMLAVELEDEFDCQSLYYDPPERVYWRKTQEKILIVGGKRLMDEKGETGEFEKISPVIQRGLEDYVKYSLGLSFKVINRWSGTMGFTAHELPYSVKLDAPLDAYMLGGFSGHGMGLGFRSALDIAEFSLGMKKETFFSHFQSSVFSL